MEPWKLEPAHDHGLTPANRARSVRRENGLLESMGHATWSLSVRAYLRVYHRMSVQGRSNIPKGPPFVLIANHASHLDALILAAALPPGFADRIFPIAAGDVFFHTDPISIFSAGFINALPMWRKNCGAHALEKLRERLIGEPCGYILFPEGARSRDGGLKPFKAGLGMLVGGTSVPVVPCAIEGAFEALRPETKVPRPKKIRVRIGEPLVFSGVAQGREGWNAVAAKAEAAVTALMVGKGSASHPARTILEQDSGDPGADSPV